MCWEGSVAVLAEANHVSGFAFAAADLPSAQALSFALLTKAVVFWEKCILAFAAAEPGVHGNGVHERDDGDGYGPRAEEPAHQAHPGAVLCFNFTFCSSPLRCWHHAHVLLWHLCFCWHSCSLFCLLKGKAAHIGPLLRRCTGYTLCPILNLKSDVATGARGCARPQL